MKKLLYMIIVVGLFGCDQDSGKATLGELDFGESEYYKPFLWVKSDTTVLSKKLILTFNDYAIEENAYVTFQMVDMNSDPLCTASNHLELFANGKYCKEGQFTVSGNDRIPDGEILLELKALPGCDEGKTEGYLKVASHNLDRVGNFSLENDPRIFQTVFNYKERMNPMLKGILVFLAIVGAVLILWFLILKRLFFPTIRIRTIQVLNPYFRAVKIKGAREVVFCNAPEKQTFFSKMFKGPIVYHYNEIWSKPFILKPGKRKSTLRKKLPAGFFMKSKDGSPVSLELHRLKDYIVESDQRQQIEIKIL